MSRPDDRLAPVVGLAPAKLNLTLAVVGRRSDGFHELHSVMAPLRLADRISLAVAVRPPDTLHVVGPGGGTLDAAVYGSVLRAIDETRRAVGRRAEAVPLAVRLEKRIPVAAGLAGGSSDAAAAVLGALAAWGAELEPTERSEVAARLGSDVPFFLAGRAALIQGRGERVDPLRGPLGGPGVLLVTPAVALPTPTVFAAFAASGGRGSGSVRMTSEHLAGEMAGGLRAADLVARAGVLAAANDLLPAAAEALPGLVAFRRALFRVLGRPVGLSGSGPSLWTLYPSEDDAADAAHVVRDALSAGDIPPLGEGQPAVFVTSIPEGPPR